MPKTRMHPTTKHHLKKIETLLSELGLTVRYEKGNFTSGYCLVERRRVAIVNRFYDTEGRIQVLHDIVEQLKVPENAELSDKSRKLLYQLKNGD